jgi:hypothetical protein
MPRVVPTEIVKIIDRWFPFAAKADEPGKGKAKLDIEHTGRVSAMIALIDRLPDELIVLPPAEYADFVASVARLRANASTAILKGKDYSFHGETVWRLRHTLSQCRDSSAAASGHGLTFITDATLRDDLRTDLAEANAALCEGRWKAATVLAGSIIEALLGSRLSELPQVTLQTAVSTIQWPSKRKPSGNDPFEWTLFQMIEVAATTKSISTPTKQQIDLARGYRNLIHPGVTLRTGERCGKDTALGALAGVERLIREFS